MIKAGIIAAVGLAILTTIGLGYWHYTSILSDREALKLQVSTLTTERDKAIKTAADNAEKIKEVEAAYKVQIAALEILASETAINEALSRQFNEDVSAADDVDIPPSLAAPFLKRFGAKP